MSSNSHNSQFSYPMALIAVWRPHQWVKNLLVLLPMLAAHRFSDIELWRNCGLAFLAFSIVCSAIYSINDLVDLKADRAHPNKCRRPLASGSLAPSSALLWAIILLGIGFSLSLYLPPLFGEALLTYFALATCYSLWGKKIVLVDLILLALFYTMRVIAGGFAAEVVVSEWLLAFCLFFFFSLGCIKRYAELNAQATADPQHSPEGRGYQVQDLSAIGTFGSASGFMAVLVMALYITNPKILALYHHPYQLWLICPLLLYWISRMWLVTYRGKMNDDPVFYAIHDKTSYIVGALGVLIGLSAI